ncbi:hypothetical protein G6W53_23910 [Streptomyces sp. KAI 90]|nr:hypothetical protein [Streptomyces sp. KAI 90]
MAARKIGGGFMELPSVVGVDRADGSVRAVDRAVDKAAGPGLPLRLGRCFLRER